MSNVRIAKSHYYLSQILVTVYWYYPGTPPKKTIDHIRVRSQPQSLESVKQFAEELPAFLKTLETEEEV